MDTPVVSQSVWYKVWINPYLPPLWLKDRCVPTSFFLETSASESCFVSKVKEMIKKICRTMVLTAYPGAIDNLDGLKAFLRSKGHSTSVEDMTVDDVINTALCFQYDQIYEIISIVRTSNCEACRYEVSGQLPHMKPGGCLYTPGVED